MPKAGLGNGARSSATPNAQAMVNAGPLISSTPVQAMNARVTAFSTIGRRAAIGSSGIGPLLCCPVQGGSEPLLGAGLGHLQALSQVFQGQVL